MAFIFCFFVVCFAVRNQYPDIFIPRTERTKSFEQINLTALRAPCVKAVVKQSVPIKLAYDAMATEVLQLDERPGQSKNSGHC